MNRFRQKAYKKRGPLYSRPLSKVADSRGMTMGELLVVVAIIIILAGVAFINVIGHQRNLALVERDNTAKEIYMAAQNHLTAVEKEGYPGLASLKDYNSGTHDVSQSDILGQSGFWEEATNDGSSGIIDEADTPGEDAWKQQNYCIIVNKGVVLDGKGAAMLALMLPANSIDETVRSGGNYIISYNRTKGRVLDVFYCSASGTKFDYHPFTESDYNTALDHKEDKTFRKTGKTSSSAVNWKNGAVLGWYGGDEALSTSNVFEKPTIKINNAERLTVDVKANAGNDVTTTLQVTGVSSGAKKTFTLKGTNPSVNVISKSNALDLEREYTVILDDVTAEDNSSTINGRHFAQLFDPADSGMFIPGEDLKIQAIDRKGKMVQYSAEKITNSLFWDVADSGTGTTSGLQNGTNPQTNNTSTIDTAYINNMRHLENLDSDVSGLNKAAGEVNINKAVQIDDLVWDDDNPESDGFISQIHKVTNLDKEKIVIRTIGNEETSGGCYWPVIFTNEKGVTDLEYNGQGHSIKGVKVDGAANAGLFGTLDNAVVKNLELIDFDISGTSTAGALAGSFIVTNNTNGLNVLDLFGLSPDSEAGDNAQTILETTTEGSRIDNVIAHNSTPDAASETRTIKGNGATAVGGLIGSVQGGKILNSAAAMTVSDGTNTGGLIGRVSGKTEITGCFSGGHTDKGEFYQHTTEGERGDAIYNVTGTTAGGLIGSFAGDKIENSYATCSVSGETAAGGLVGTAIGSINNCYCAGKVDTSQLEEEGVTIGAFAGSSSATLSNCFYYEIMNEITPKTQGELIEYLGAVDNTNENLTGIEAFDKNVESYEKFVGGRGTWAPANAYDKDTRKYYKLKYNLRTVDQLPATADKQPQPTSGGQEITINGDGIRQFTDTHYGDWPAPEVFIINP